MCISYIWIYSLYVKTKNVPRILGRELKSFKFENVFINQCLFIIINIAIQSLESNMENSK